MRRLLCDASVVLVALIGMALAGCQSPATQSQENQSVAPTTQPSAGEMGTDNSSVGNGAYGMPPPGQHE
jgi:hypothetical protein